MKVFCIDDRDQPCVFDDVPFVKKGNIYTVIESKYSKEIRTGRVRFLAGTYYVLAECGNKAGYHESMFIEINENQIDETEMIREYNLTPEKLHAHQLSWYTKRLKEETRIEARSFLRAELHRLKKQIQ